MNLTRAYFFKERAMGYNHINVLLHTETYELLRKYCNERNLKISDVVRKGIYQILEIPRPTNFKAVTNGNYDKL